MLCIGSLLAPQPSSHVRHPETSKASKALRTLMLCPANIPGTDGRKMVQRHVGHAMNFVYGNCILLATFNFADTSKPVHKLYVDGRVRSE